MPMSPIQKRSATEQSSNSATFPNLSWTVSIYVQAVIIAPRHGFHCEKYQIESNQILKLVCDNDIMMLGFQLHQSTDVLDAIIPQYLRFFSW